MKLIAICSICLALAIGLGLQALSSIVTRKSPNQALVFLPTNGEAREQSAFRLFQRQLDEGYAIDIAAKSALPQAISGLKTDPLAPKAHAILALTELRSNDREKVLRLANKLNRRDLALQGLVLQMHLDAEDYSNVISTLDQILRVHPEYYENFFPLLLDAVKVDSAAELFPNILTGEADWHESFLIFAVKDPEAQENLAGIRDRLKIQNTGFDKRLIAGLAAQGKLEAAREIYDEIRESRERKRLGKEDFWLSDYQPFDWALADQRDFRAQPSRDGAKLELYARSGQGGTIGRRIIVTPRLPFQMVTFLKMRASGRSDTVRLSLRCDIGGPPFLDRVLSPGNNVIVVDRLASNCTQFMIEIHARALRGEPTLRAELSAITFEPV